MHRFSVFRADMPCAKEDKNIVRAEKQARTILRETAAGSLRNNQMKDPQRKVRVKQ